MGAPNGEGTDRRACETSSGVFLWVRLAVKSLLKDLTNMDRVPDLRRALQELPPELDDLFSHMLKNIQPDFYVEQGSKLLQLVYQYEDSMSALELSFADEEDETLRYMHGSVTWTMPRCSDVWKQSTAV